MNINVKQKLLFLLGIGTAIAVELLAKGPWAHAVWAPVALMLFTDLEGVFDAKKAVAAIPQRVRILVGIGGALAVEIFAGGKWAHAVWAPAAIMLFTDIEKVLGIAPPATPASSPPPTPPDNSEAVTPLDKPK